MSTFAASPHAISNEDVAVFADNCVFMRSIYLHGRTLFELSSAEDKERMSKTAGTFFGDLNRMFIEYMILQVCKITDPARDVRGSDNHTVAFLLSKYDSGGDCAKKATLDALNDRLQRFRRKLLPARNKLISHSDRAAILAGAALGGAPQTDWDQFWLDLQDVVCIIYERVFGRPFYINGVAMLSDADELLKALKLAACFDELMKDPSLASRCANLALR
jgi:hypothetical protein